MNIKTLVQKDEEEAIKLLATYFPVGDAISDVFQLTPADWDKMVRMVVRTDGISVGCRNENGRLVGVLIGTDFNVGLSEDDVHALGPKWEAVLAALDILEKAFLIEMGYEKGVPEGIIAHGWIGAVAPETRGKGVLGGLFDALLVNAKSKGYKYYVHEPISEYSRILSVKRKMKMVKEVIFSEFEYKGEKPFLRCPAPHKDFSIFYIGLD